MARSLLNQDCSELTVKRKHWQGYGSVNMTLISRTNKEVYIKVKGNHECGLSFPFYDIYRLTQWMGKLGKFTQEQVSSYESSEVTPVLGIDTCIYVVQLKEVT